ncbi:MAG: hypothetical protein FJX74_20485, partial [Armatimonadetes bacterium]|nr:hypothetical protein [Armatimonadota bacterium]
MWPRWISLLVVFLLGVAGARAADYAFAPDSGEGDYTLAFEVPSPSAWPQGAALRVAFDWQSPAAHHAAVLTREGAWFEEIAEGQTRRLGPTGPWPAVGGTAGISVRRRAWAMGLLCDGRGVVTAYDEQPFGGRVGVLADGVALSPEDVVVQPVEPVQFADDFMRGPGEAELWTVVSGQWRNVGLSGGKGQLRAELSANPFSLRCSGAGPQLITVGDWFWDSYAASVAVKAMAPNGIIGLAFGVQDGRNCYLLSLGRTAGDASPQLRLLRVVDGQPRVLGVAVGGYEPDLWSRLSARTSNGLIEGWLDGELRLSVHDTTFGQGGIGLFAQDVGDGWFDDVTIEPWEAFSDPFDSPNLSAWLQMGGQWEAGDGRLRATSSVDRPAGVLVGPASWCGYEIAADAVAGDAQGVGLYACAEGASGWYLFYWARGEPLGTWHLLRMGDGRPVSLASMPGDLDRETPQRLSMAVGNGLIDCRVAGQPVFAVADFTRPAGAAGLRAEG